MKTTVKILASLSILVAAFSCQQFKIDTQMTPERMAANARLESDVLTSYTLSATNPQPITFNISANVPWTIIRSGNAEWCDITPAYSSAAGLNADITISAMENETSEDRSVSFTLKSETYQAKTYTFTVTQGRKGKLYVTPIAKKYSAMGGPLTFTINTNYPWEVRSSETWLSFNLNSGEGSDNLISIIATAEASSVMTRTATVTVVANDYEESFEVTQQGKFEITEPGSVVSAAGGDVAFKLNTDLDWEIKADKMWVTFAKEKGTGTGSAETLTLTVAANEGAARTATVTITAGEEDKTFEVSQEGAKFEIVEPASTQIGGNNGELVLEVNTTLTWEPYSDADWLTVEKVDASHFKVVGAWNPVFAARTGKVGIKAGSVTRDIELTQDTNFTLSAECEVQADGSVKVSSGGKVTFKEGLRHFGLKLTMGEKNFGDAGQLWVNGKLGEVNIYNQLSLDGKKRIRTDGNMANGESGYKSTDHSPAPTKADLNAMETYEFGFQTNASDKTKMDMEFKLNGTSLAKHTGPNAFYYDQVSTVSYFFGFYSATSDGSWYVIKSCDLTVYAENYE